MALQYRVKKVRMNYKKEKPEGYQVQMLNQTIITEENLLEYITESAHIPKSTMKAAAMAIAEAVSFYVINGHKVVFKNFGKFHLKVQNTCVDTLDECLADTVKRTQLCFTPSADIKRVLDETNLQNYKTLNEE